MRLLACLTHYGQPLTSIWVSSMLFGRLRYDSASLLDTNRVTFVPHAGQVPLAIGRPFDVFSTVPSLIVRFLRHLMQ